MTGPAKSRAPIDTASGPLDARDPVANRASTPPATVFDPRLRGLTIGTVALVALYAFEALAVTTAMPTVARELQGLSLYAMSFAATLASSVVGLVAAGQWADRQGPRAPLQHGIAWFAIGLVVAGLSQDMWTLLFGRLVQGLGGGMMSVALYVVVGRIYPPDLHAKIFAAFAAAWVLPAVLGPAISGLIVEHLGWRWVFLSVPVLALVAALLVLPALRGVGAPGNDGTALGDNRDKLWWSVGAAVSALALHHGGQQHGWSAVAWLSGSLIALITCTLQLLPRGTLRADRGLPTVVALRGLASAAFFGTEVFLPLLLSRERGLSPALAGAILTVGALGWSAGSWWRGRMSSPSATTLARSGMALISGGIALTACAAWPAVPLGVSVSGWVLAGLGMGLVFPTLSVLTLELSTQAQQGVNSSALQLSDALFTAAVLAVGGSLFAALLERSPTAAYASGFSLSVLLAVLGVALAGRTSPTASPA